ncbi:hypothetical protein [Variovorax saccharolyticus]|uniref:hypothetical protein n=1 Tax=Variovorax saccharolyticus TaxID=3053516 RepID=UPI00257842C1|nr:hypothetical protein [Variovorax sp. J22R187]MDM0018181.1 hypothetical protein [Variovorax sp. J22R187]
MNALDPTVARELTTPGFTNRLRRAILQGRISSERAAELVVDLRQFARAENNERSRPGEYMGDDAMPYLPMPFANREQHRPDRAPGTPTHAILKQATDNIDADTVTEGLQSRLGVDRVDITAPPTLHETIEAAYRLHTGE